MKRIASLLGVALAVAAMSAPVRAQDVLPSSVLVTNATLTNVWAAGASLDLASYDSATLVMQTTSNDASGLVQLKFQWSADGSVWADESVLAAGSTVGLTQPYTALSRIVQVPTTNSVFYAERFRRVARYLRPAYSSTNAVTVGRITISGQKMNSRN